MIDEAHRLMPHAVQQGHLVGPHSKIAIDTIEDPERLEKHRQELLGRKQQLKGQLQDRHEPEISRAPSGPQQWFEPIELAMLELRDDAALVDQYLYPYGVARPDGSLSYDYRLATSFRHDDRFWSRVVRKERLFIKKFVVPQERFFLWFIGPQQRARDAWKAKRKGAEGAGAKALHWFLLIPFIVFALFVKIQELLLLGLARGQAALLNKIVDFPLTIKEGALDTQHEFTTKGGRRKLVKAIFDESYITPERRRVLLFMSSIFLILGWLLAEILLQATYPEAVEPGGPKNMTDALLFTTIGAKLFLPVPFEALIPPTAEVIGAVPTVIVAVVGSVIGSWLIFIVGGEASVAMEELINRKAALRRPYEWLKQNAHKYGYAVLGVILAIPLAPDGPPLVLFSLLKLRMKYFLMTVTLSALVRSTLTLLFADVFAG